MNQESDVVIVDQAVDVNVVNAVRGEFYFILIFGLLFSNLFKKQLIQKQEKTKNAMTINIASAYFVNNKSL